MILNNRILRILQDKRRDTNTTELYSMYNTLPIDKLYKFKLLTYAHAIFYKTIILPDWFHNNFNFNTNIYSHWTRTSSDLHKTTTNSAAGTKLSKNKITSLWNSLPQDIKNISSLVKFKKVSNYTY